MERVGCLPFLLLGAVLVFSGCRQAGDLATTEIPLMEPVGTNAETETVLVRDLYDLVVKDGEYTPYTEELCFEEGGTIENIFVMLGERVQKGDLLAELSEWGYVMAEAQASSKYWDEKQKMEAQIAEYEENIKESKTAEDREWYELLKRQTEESYAQREPELQKIWDAAKARLGNNTLMAPFDGVVTAVRANGDRLATGQAAVAISDLKRGVVAVDGYLSPGDYEDYDEIYAMAGGEKVSLVYDPELQNEDKAYTLFRFGEECNAAYGDFIAVCFVKNVHKQVLSVPNTVVTRERGKAYVYLQEGEKWVRTEVTTGYGNNVYVEITGGLKEGDKVYAQ